MADFRIPGPLTERAKSERAHLSLIKQWVKEIQAEQYRRCQPGPLGCYSLESEADRQQSEPEFRVMKKFCVKGVGAGSGDAFADLDDYLAFRNDYFESARDYWTFALASDREFEQHGDLLERLLPDPWRKRKAKVPGFTKGQHYLYRWVRKAYIKAGVADTDVPKVIKSGMTEELREALERVKASYANPFRAGGFVPRPKKVQGGMFRLGTLSEHGTGTAVDVESDRNPDLSVTVWKKLETYTGKTVVRSESRWRTHPRDLWEDIRQLNRLFVEKLETDAETEWEKKKIEAEQNGKAAPSQQDMKTAFKKERARELGLHEPYVTGFFMLEWALVEAFHDNDFWWGAVFSNTVDLHHFELR